MATTAELPLITRPTTTSSVSAIVAWLNTVDHKLIGLSYIGTAFIFFLLGGIQALLIRAQLTVPDGTLLDPQTYNQIFTMHGRTMIFLFAMPMLTGFANYVVPLQIGTRDMAFPRLNAFGYWGFLLGGLFMYASYFYLRQANAGWPPGSVERPDLLIPGLNTNTGDHEADRQTHAGAGAEPHGCPRSARSIEATCSAISSDRSWLSTEDRRARAYRSPSSAPYTTCSTRLPMTGNGPAPRADPSEPAPTIGRKTTTDPTQGTRLKTTPRRQPGPARRGSASAA